MVQLFGRARETGTLRTALVQAMQGNGRLVLISGEAGIGKTALVQQSVTEARNQHALVLTGGAYDLTSTPPYGPWLDLIRTYPDDETLPTLPEFMTSREAVAALGSQEELQRAVLAFFKQACHVRPLVLVLEDLHWADHPSLELLRVFARGIESEPIMLVGTWRDDEITRQHALYHLLPALVRESGAERIELRALDAEAIQDLVRTSYSLDRTEARALVDYLLSRGEGNPLFTVELLRTLESEGALSYRDGIWQVEHLTEDAVPDLVRQMVERRMSDLSMETIRALQLAAVIGQIVSLERWEQVTDHPVGTAAEEALEMNLVEETPDGEGVAFRHAVIREAIYETVSLPRKRQVHQQVAEAYLTDARPDPEIVAWHLKQARDPRTADWLILAGEQAERRFAWREAFERHSEAADLLRNQPESDRQLARLLLKIGRMLRFLDPRRGIDYHEEARRIALQHGDEVIAALALFNAGSQLCMLGEPDPGLNYMRNAVETLVNSSEDIEPATRWSQTLVSANMDPLLSSIGTLIAQHAYAGRFHDSIDLAGQYLDLDWREAGSEIQGTEAFVKAVSFGDGYWGLGIAHSALGNLEDGRLGFEIIADMLKRLDYESHRTFVISSYLVIHHLVFRTADLAGRERIVEDIERNERIASGSAGLRNTAWGYEWCLLLEGKWNELQQLIAARELPTLAVFRNTALSARARLAWYQGRLDDAWDLIHNMVPNGPGCGSEDHMHFLQREPHRIAAGLALDADDLTSAREWLGSHDDWLDRSGAVLGRPDGLLLWARLRLAEGEPDTARELAEQAMEHARDPEQPTVLIQIHRFQGELATRIGNPESATYHLQQSLELVERCALPFERALTLLAMAELTSSQGDRDEAARLLKAANRVFVELNARPALERVEDLSARMGSRGRDARFGLTRRELEVLEMVVQGRTDREIAEALFISPRTAMHHVSNILRKLDVESRTAAAAEALRQDLV